MLNEKISPQTLGVARVLVFGLWIVTVSGIHLEDVAGLPHDILGRYGVLRLIPEPLWEALWTPGFLVGFRLVLLAALVWLVLGLGRYTAVAIVTCVMLTLFDGMAKSMGHLNHSKFAILFCAYILAAFPASDAVALRPRRGERAPDAYYAAPMVAMATLIFLTYGFVGAWRIAEGGFSVFASDALPRWFLYRSLEANATGFELGRWIVEHPPLLSLAKAGFTVVGTMEVLSPLCLVSRYFRWAWMAVVAPFHVASLFTLNIFFWENALLILFVVSDCNRVFSPRPARAGRPILFFDAECVVCNRAARLLLSLDRDHSFNLASVEGATAKELLAGEDLAGVDSIILLDEKGCHVRSEAALRTATRLGGLWGGVNLLRIFPRSLRDRAYDAFASRRTQWFGRVESCGLLSPEERSRVLP